MSTLRDWKPVYSGKVRELYIPIEASSVSDAQRLLIIATDRVSAFDYVLEPEIPGKGSLLTQLSHWWFDQLEDVPNHLVGETPPKEVLNNAMVVTPLVMFPIECVVRGYIAGSGWTEYRQTGAISQVPLPPGLSEGDHLPEPIFTPATKAALGDHDENISFAEMSSQLGSEVAEALRALTLSIYTRARDIAADRGLILADTKLEFGRHPVTGEITLGDEVLTSDSSRYWDKETYSAGGINRLDSFDKQLIRNWLSENWDGTGRPPALPPELVQHTLNRYQELITRLTGLEAN